MSTKKVDGDAFVMRARDALTRSLRELSGRPRKELSADAEQVILDAGVLLLALDEQDRRARFEPTRAAWTHADGSPHSKAGPLGCLMCANARRGVNT